MSLATQTAETGIVPGERGELKGQFHRPKTVDINQRKKSTILVILGSLIAWAISLWLLAWVYEGNATGYTPYACGGVSPDIRPAQCNTNLVLDNVAYVIWGVSWLVLAIAGIVYHKLSKVT